MKLIIQIPCFNEEATLPETLRGLPRQIAGIDKIEVLSHGQVRRARLYYLRELSGKAARVEDAQ